MSYPRLFVTEARRILSTGDNPPGHSTDFGDEGSTLTEAVDIIEAMLDAISTLDETRQRIVIAKAGERFAELRRKSEEWQGERLVDAKWPAR